MPIYTRNPLAMTAADVREIGEKYKPSRWCHIAVHDHVTGELAGYRGTDSTGVERLAHWGFLIDRLAELQNTETSLFRKILTAFNQAFGSEVSVKPFFRSVLNQPGRTSGAILAVGERLEVVKHVADEMRRAKARYVPLCADPDKLTISLVRRIGSEYEPGVSVRWGIFSSHVPWHSELAGRLKQFGGDAIDLHPQLCWGQLAMIYGELRSHQTQLAVMIRRCFEEAFRCELSVAEDFSMPFFVGSLKRLVEEHYESGVELVPLSVRGCRTR